MATKVARIFAEVSFEILVALTIALTLAVLATPAKADCGVFYRKRVVVQQVAYAYAQPIYVAPPVYYSAGDELKIRAIAVQEARQAVKQELALIQQQAHQQFRQQQAAPQAPAVFAKCIRCHTGPEAKAGLVLDGSALDCHAHFRWCEMAGLGKNVPAPMKGLLASMSPDEKGAVQEEMLRLVAEGYARQERLPPPPVPVPDPIDRPPPPPEPEGGGLQ